MSRNETCTSIDALVAPFSPSEVHMPQPQAPVEDGNDNALGNRIREMRTTWEWSQEKLGEVLGVNRKTVSHWEKGRWPPNDSALQCLSYLSGLSQEAWKSGEGFYLVNPPMLLNDYYVPGDWTSSVTLLPRTRGGDICMVNPINEWASQILPYGAVIKKIQDAMKARKPIWVIINQ